MSGLMRRTWESQRVDGSSSTSLAKLLHACIASGVRCVYKRPKEALPARFPAGARPRRCYTEKSSTLRASLAHCAGVVDSSEALQARLAPSRARSAPLGGRLRSFPALWSVRVAQTTYAGHQREWTHRSSLSVGRTGASLVG